MRKMKLLVELQRKHDNTPFTIWVACFRICVMINPVYHGPGLLESRKP